MKKKQIFIRNLRSPAWGTLVAAMYTLILLVRMGNEYPAADLGLLALACLIELAAIDLSTRAALHIRPIMLRLPALSVPAVLGTIYVAQLYSTWISGGFIPPIAFANREVTGLISFSGFYKLLGVFFAAFVAHALWYRKRPRPLSVATTIAGLATLAAVYALLVSNQPLARGIIVARGETPVSSFAHSVFMYAGLSSHTRLSSVELGAIRAGFSRRTVYEQGFPEDITRNLPEHPNVIVVFTEGMSARWMDAYGGMHPGLSPNLDRLADGSLLFTNYYNHTAATFRGLRGQLTSGHQEIDGFNEEGTGIGQRDVSHDITAISRISVPEILRAHGYRSLFFLSQQKYLNKMIETIGFDRTLGRDYLYDTYLRKSESGQTSRPAYLSDPQLFDTMLAELEAQPADKPFFAAVYNFQTHAFLDGEAKYGDGGNSVLNRFHTYDRDVGRFIRRFMASRLHSNTVLVFTSDHSTFPGPSAVKADDRMPRYFVDTIPLLIYWKGVEHRTIDVAGKNSLDLAPSLLSLLGVQKAHNLFMGCTFFEQCALDRVSNIGGEYILTSPQGSYPESQVPETQQAFYQESRQSIERYKSMDLIIDTRQ
ncbi:putative transmembrane sulfatase protein [uncultured Stenotrophomonas sp.]|uniref:Putative transmembrane sulfatase protein n=1 Tax=uncultured Stenotrophomonas sp. TaxID=165438 RepID=A0A1Y5Q429_9GAMM|nr:putative transmembrane sulfatase protein [uncultured Stenotrophomonas sp.]